MCFRMRHQIVWATTDFDDFVDVFIDEMWVSEHGRSV